MKTNIGFLLALVILLSGSLLTVTAIDMDNHKEAMSDVTMDENESNWYIEEYIEENVDSKEVTAKLISRYLEAVL